MKYFEVTAKCGHVGKHNFYEGRFFIISETGKKAAEKVRYKPRVKHDHKDAILSVKEINIQDFLQGIKSDNRNPYYKCKNIQEQRKYFDEIEPHIFPEILHFNKRTKKHSLNSIYNFDPDYEKVKYNKDINYCIY